VERNEFERIDRELTEAANKVLNQRRQAYAGNGDVLRNFKQVAEATGLSVAKVWEVYFRKALNAACAVVAGGETAGESREERIVDLLNYVRLGNAIAQENNTVLAEGKPTAQEPVKEFEKLNEMMDRIQKEQDVRAPWRYPYEVPTAPRWERLRSPKASNRVLD
jgi:hypothetical protein